MNEHPATVPTPKAELSNGVPQRYMASASKGNI
jgi:hypothetical protein